MKQGGGEIAALSRGLDMSYGSSEPEITGQGNESGMGEGSSSPLHPPDCVKTAAMHHDLLTDLKDPIHGKMQTIETHGDEEDVREGDDEEAEAAAAVLGSLRHQSGGRSAFTSMTVFLPRPGDGGSNDSPSAPSKGQHKGNHLNQTANPGPLAQVDQQVRTTKMLSSPSINAAPVAVPGLLLPSIPPLIPSFFPVGNGDSLQPMSAAQIANALPSQHFLQQPAMSQVLLPDSVMHLISALSAAKAPKAQGSSMPGQFSGHQGASTIPCYGEGLMGFMSEDNAVGKAMRRQAAVSKYLLKRKNRCFHKTVRYESRKKLADSRPRVRGQFVKYSADGEAPQPSNNIASEPPATANGRAAPVGKDAEESSQGGPMIESEDEAAGNGGMSVDEP